MNTIHFVWRHRALSLIALAQICASAGFAVPVSTLYLLSRGLSYTQVFTLETVLVVSILLCDLPTGMIADRTSDRAVLVSGYLVAAAADVVWAFAHSFLAFVIANVLSGLAIALTSGADTSYLVSVLTSEHESRLTGVLGHFGVLANIAGAAAGVIGGLLARGDIAWPSLAVAGASCLAAACALALPDASRPTAGPEHRDEPTSLVGVARLVLSTPVLWLSALQPWILVGAAFYLNQPRWQATGVPVTWFGVILAGASLAAAAGSHLSERASALVGSPTRLIALSTAATAAGFGLLAAPAAWSTVVGFVLVLASSSLRGPVGGALTTMAAPSRSRAFTLSMVGTCSSLVGAALNPVVGALAEFDVQLACLAVAGALVVFAIAWALVSGR